jgi:hypothetical protein
VAHARDLVERGKRKVREKALRKFRMERELADQKKQLLENQKRHEDMLRAREKERSDQLRAYRERDRQFKLHAKQLRETQLKAERLHAKREHERESLERLADARAKKDKEDARVLKLQHTRREFEAKRRAERTARTAAEIRMSAERSARISAQTQSATARRTETLSMERSKTAMVSEKRRQDRLRMEALRQEREVARIAVLQKHEEVYGHKIAKHSSLRKQEEDKRALVFAERDRKILQKQRQKEERAVAHEERMLATVHEGGKHFEALKAKKAKDAQREALYQRLKSEEAQAKVRRQRNLEDAQMVAIKARIDKKELRLRAMAQKEKHLKNARAALKRETRIFSRDVQHLVDESVRTSNWCEKKQSQLFEGVSQREIDTELAETAAVAVAVAGEDKPWKKPPRKAGSPPPQVGADPHLQKKHRDRSHAPRWVRGHSDHEHIIAHLEEHDKHGHETALAATEDHDPTKTSPVRPAHRLGSTIGSRLRPGVVSPRTKRIGAKPKARRKSLGRKKTRSMSKSSASSSLGRKGGGVVVKSRVYSGSNNRIMLPTSRDIPPDILI